MIPGTRYHLLRVMQAAAAPAPALVAAFLAVTASRERRPGKGYTAQPAAVRGVRVHRVLTSWPWWACHGQRILPDGGLRPRLTAGPKAHS